jgi:hypothetical protein
MGVITISAIGLGPELISGIPMLVALGTNVPATIFYTLDGSLPTALSQVYLSPIVTPTYMNSVRIRAYAVSGSDKGYLDITYKTDSSDLVYPRRVDGYGLGIAVDAYNVTDVLTDGYGPDIYGNVNIPVRSSDYELVDLDIKYSRTGPDGYGPGTMITMGVPPISQLEKASAVYWGASSPNNQNVFFNPKALYIVIDGRDGYEDQSVYPILRPWAGTRDSVKYLQGKEFFEPQPYISGGHVRTFYNYETGTAVSYYFDHNETRWIKSIQNFDPQTVPQNIGSRNQTGPPIVFKWIYNKRSAI